MEPKLLTEPPIRPRVVNGTLFDIRKAAENSEKPINTIPKNVYKKSEIHEYLKNRTYKKKNFKHWKGGHVPDKEIDADKTLEISSTTETTKTTCTKSTDLG